MTVPYEQQLALVRQHKVVARNNIRRAGVTLSDPSDYRRFVDAQWMRLRGLELEEQQLRALLHKPRRPPVRISPAAVAKARSKSGRVVVLTFPEFRDAILSGTLKSRVKYGNFQVLATARQMSGLGEMVKRLRSLP